MLVDSSVTDPTEYWYSLTPARNDLLIKRCGFPGRDTGASTSGPGDLGLRRRWPASATHRASSYEKVRKKGLERFDEFALVAPLTKSLDLSLGNVPLTICPAGAGAGASRCARVTPSFWIHHRLSTARQASRSSVGTAFWHPIISTHDNLMTRACKEGRGRLFSRATKFAVTRGTDAVAFTI